MADEGAVATLEAPVESPVETTITSDSGADTGASSGVSGTDGSQQIDNGDTPQAGETGHLRGAELYRAVKEKLKNGEKLDAREIRSIRNAIHIADKADRATGGNLDAFESERQIYSRLTDDAEAGYTAEQIVEQTLDERNFWRDFDEKFEKGDPALIPQMLEANPEAFQQLIPRAMDEFARVNPEGFSAYVAKSAKGYLDGKQIPLQFAILQTFVPNMPDFPGKDRVIAAINEIYGAVSGLDEMAAKPIAPKLAEGTQKQTGGIDQREERLTQKEMDITRREWNGETHQVGTGLRDSEMQRLATAQKVTLDDSDKAKIRAAVLEEYNARCAANTKYGQAMRGYIQAGNKRAYIDRATSEYRKLIPSITARHTQAVIDAKKAAGTQKQTQNANGNGQQRQTTTQRTTDHSGNLAQWISGHPKTIGKRVDLLRTTNAMLNRNEAYIVGEKGLFKWKPKTA